MLKIQKWSNLAQNGQKPDFSQNGPDRRIPDQIFWNQHHLIWIYDYCVVVVIVVVVFVVVIGGGVVVVFVGFFVRRRRPHFSLGAQGRHSSPKLTWHCPRHGIVRA